MNINIHILKKHFKSLHKIIVFYFYFSAFAIIFVMLEPANSIYPDEDIEISLKNIFYLALFLIILLECDLIKNSMKKLVIINYTSLLFFTFTLSILIINLLKYNDTHYYWTYGIGIQLLAYAHVIFKNFSLKRNTKHTNLYLMI